MKKTKFLAFFLSILMVLSCLCGCYIGEPKAQGTSYEITLDPELSLTLKVGDEPDFTKYFVVKDQNGNQILVTQAMLDLSDVDTSAPGTFTVTITVGSSSKTVTFTVTSSGYSLPDAATFRAMLQEYADEANWNFAVSMTMLYDGDTYEEYYEYLGHHVSNTYTATDGASYTDYLGYDALTDTYSFYSDNGDGTYEVYAEGSDEFDELYSMLFILDLTALSDFTFTADGDRYIADDPVAAGNTVIAEFEDGEWVTLAVYVADGHIAKIVGEMNDGYIEEYEFSKHGTVHFTLPTAGSNGTTTPTDTMPRQTYNSATFDDENLQDKMMRTDGAIGLPSTGEFHALVIPVQFKGDAITRSQLNSLEKAFNGPSADTGWESVRSYYYKASYGKLNLTFDIQDVYMAQNNASYYEKYNQPYVQDGETFTRTGEEVILTEALAYYEDRIDLTKYDTNGDDVIDAVYLIYSAPVDYDNGDFYWAYVTWYYGETKYDGLDAYYYLFAGFDFMDESTANDPGSGYDEIPGLTVNAATYIHETGHLLGLDDYYDYDTSTGSNEGLGGADMMDYNVGDQNVYSKIMLGWITPTVVNESKTVTIQSSALSSESAILIPLDFNNSYFCEYLLIDLYSATELNELHASVSGSLLYDGADYGVRIYHVSSSVDIPYDNDYGSYTQYNNSDTKYSLIKLVEADGDRKFSSSGGYASESDLWQTGDRLSSVFPAYTRNDGKRLCFDIAMNSVTALSARITVTFS